MGVKLCAWRPAGSGLRWRDAWGEPQRRSKPVPQAGELAAGPAGGLQGSGACPAAQANNLRGSDRCSVLNPVANSSRLPTCRNCPAAFSRTPLPNSASAVLILRATSPAPCPPTGRLSTSLLSESGKLAPPPSPRGP